MNSVGHECIYIPPMRRPSSSQLIVVAAFAALAPLAARGGLGVASAQGNSTPANPSCAAPDSITFVGSTRRSYAVLREDAGLPVGQPVTAAALQRAEKNILATGHFDDLQTECLVENGKTTVRFKLV